MVRDLEYAAYMKNRFSYWDAHPEKNPDRVHPEEAAARNKKWKKDNPAQYALSNARHSSKRDRSLGFVPMNQPFDGCEGHHINENDVIYIPHALHRSIAHNVFTGKNMAEINAKACAWLTEDWT